MWIFWINQFLVFLDAHCSGVKVFWVNACITFNSSCNTALTILCLASRPTPSNFLDTITASNLPPQPSLRSVTYETHEMILISFSKNATLYLKLQGLSIRYNFKLLLPHNALLLTLWLAYPLWMLRYKMTFFHKYKTHRMYYLKYLKYYWMTVM